MSRLLWTLLVLSCSALTAWSAAPPTMPRWGTGLEEPISDQTPKGARLRIGWTVCRHGGVVRAVVFSPNGRGLASASHDHTASIWDLNQFAREALRIRSHAADVLCVSFSADNRFFASGGADGVVRLWSLRGRTSGQELYAFTSKAEAIETLAFSPNGKILAAGGDDGSLRLYDVARKELLRQMSQDRAIRCLAWSTDGKVIATNAAKQAVALWDAGRGSLLRTFGDEAINALAFSPDGRQLVTWESGGTLRLWDLDKGTQIRTWGGSDDNSSGGEALIYQIAFSHDGKSVFCGSTSGAIDVWDPATGKRRRQMLGHQGRVPALALEPQGGILGKGKLLATGGADGTIRLWDIDNGKAVTSSREPVGPIHSLSLAPTGDQLALVFGSGKVQLRNRLTGKQLPVNFKGTAQAAAFGADGVLNLIDGEGRLVRWNPKTGKQTTRKEPGTGATGLALSPDGKMMVTTHRDGSVWLRDGQGKQLRMCQGKERRVSVAVAPEGKLVAAVGQQSFVSMWTGKTGKIASFVPGHRGGTLAVAISADGKLLATGGRDRMVRILDLGKREELRLPSGHTAWVCAVAFSPDGKLLVSATIEGDVYVWSPHSGRLLAELEGHRGPVTALAFADGKTLVSAGRDASVLVWDVSAANAGKVSPVALAPAGREKLWGLLLHSDSAVASLAMQRLARDPAGVVPQFRARLKAVDGKKIARLLADLDDEAYAKRDAAFKGLAAFGAFAEGSLRQALAKKPNLETHRRLEELIDRLAQERIASEHLRALRSVEVLELIGNAEARKVLETLAGGAAEAELTRKAKAALARLAKKR
jgi:WD40 repeat protein